MIYDLSKNYEISRKLASQGMVLLKNEDDTLPLGSKDNVGIIGKECLDLINGGGGSSKVKCEYIRSLVDGLTEKADLKKLRLAEYTIEVAENTSEYDLALLNRIAADTDKVIVTYKRYGREHADRKLARDESLTGVRYMEAEEDGYFYPSEAELHLLENLERSEVKDVVLILNVSSTVDLSFIERFSKIKAVLLTYLPGMESGTAIADVLCGDVNPSGKLVDTIAYDYADYPTADGFDTDKWETKYNEGIYVGYRYFETFAKEKVLYPFGFGLSYTQFEYSNCTFEKEQDGITVSVNVTNTGKVPGREVVQVYVCAPDGKLEKPAIELKGFAKTKDLEPGETEAVKISFKIKDMASFDTDGVTGYTAAWVLEAGNYEIFAGKSVRDLYSCGSYYVEETVLTEQLTARFGGSKYSYQSKLFTDELFETDEKLSLYDVSEGKMELSQFVNRLTPEELVSLSLGQPLAFPMGTSGVGNIRKYDIPNAQTADGPAGIRRSVNTTCFPCGTLIACSWDSELQYAMGRAMGEEGYSTEIDILLASSMNIHRNPLCGRNFEYLSEDPLITGKTAAALVNGMQSQGLCATIKHFAANNCEDFRNINNSIVEERALREIYLKGFEIAVKEADPAYVMTSYNLLNGEHASANAQLLRGVLRDEWNYEGATMTDWRNGVSLVSEIIAGNNIKMPFGYPDEGEKALQAYRNGELPLAVLRENAFYVLRSIMKTRAFKQHDFGKIHRMKEAVLDIPVMETNGLASSRTNHATREDGVEYLWRLNREQRDQRSFVYYVVEIPKAGRYTVSAEISTNCPETQIWYYDENDDRIGTAYCDKAVDEEQWYNVETEIHLHEGENTLKLVFANEPYHDYEFYNPGPEEPNVWPEIAKEDIRLAKLRIIKKQ